MLIIIPPDTTKYLHPPIKSIVFESVIDSVLGIAEEGAAMHHCVYEMGYHKKPHSLIMSARDRQGNRIETIELSLKTFKVVQSRGVCNKNTPRHNEILKLVRDNIDLIKRAVRIE